MFDSRNNMIQINRFFTEDDNSEKISEALLSGLDVIVDESVDYIEVTPVEKNGKKV